MNNNDKFLLKFKHKDFICKQIALFKTHCQVAEELLKEFPELPLSLEQATSRVKHYACNKRTVKWLNRIIQYRQMMEYEFPNRYRLANKHQRMMELERIFADAMTPKLRRVIWFPVSKPPKGHITYGHKELHEPDLHTAINVLTTIPKELDDLCFSYYGPPVRITKSLTSEAIVKKLQRWLKKLDLTFGIK